MSLLLDLISEGTTTQVDSRDKRASALGVGLEWFRVRPNPSGNISSVADKQHMAVSYSQGSTVDSAVGATGLFRALLGVG